MKTNKELDAAIEYLESLKFDTCCSGTECGCMGLPIDPEYYILQDLYKVKQELQKITEERDLYLSYLKMRGYGES